MKQTVRTLAQYMTRRGWYLYAIAFLAYLGLLLVFFELADEIGEKETLAFDVATLRAIYSFSNPMLDVAMVNMTMLGGVWFVLAVTLVLLSFFYHKKWYRSFFLTLVTMAGSTGLIVALKQYFSRERPGLWEQIIIEQSYSFPSGHSVASSALALTLIAILWNTQYRIPSLIVGLLYMLVIGFSRMYLGVHYPTDIVAGWIISALWIGFVLVLIKTIGKYYGR